MTKQQILENFMILIAQMQNIAVDIIDEKHYDDFSDFMDDVFSNLDHDIEDHPDQVELVISTPKSTKVFGNVDRQRVMQEIGDNQALMIFAQESEIEEEF